MTVTVTPDDIRRGKRADGLADPIALALRRTTGRLWFVANAWVAPIPEHAEKSDGALATALARRGPEYPLPAEVRAWIRQYDRATNPDLTPITIELPIDPEEPAAAGVMTAAAPPSWDARQMALDLEASHGA